MDYSIKLFADMGDSNSTYNSHRAYSFSDKVFTAGFSSVMLKVCQSRDVLSFSRYVYSPQSSETGPDGCFDISAFATSELLGRPNASEPRSLPSLKVSGRIVDAGSVPSSWQACCYCSSATLRAPSFSLQVDGLRALGECRATSFTPALLPDDAYTPDM